MYDEEQFFKEEGMRIQILIVTLNYEFEMYAIIHPNHLIHPHHSRLGS
jgi:hypothetical protein